MANNESIKRNWTNWFEIPVTNLQQAKNFTKSFSIRKLQYLILEDLKWESSPARK